MRHTLVMIILGLAVGAGIGLTVGWIAPINSPQTAPSVLSAEWQSDWVLMTAQAYSLDGDLNLARQRLALLGAGDAGAQVAQRGEDALAEGLPPAYIGTLARLAAALGARTPTLAPYLAQ
jgi:hypothetical protein